MAAISTTVMMSPLGGALFSGESDAPPGESPFAKARAIEARMNGTFYFYGKIVDQYDRPVVGATVILDASRIAAGPTSAIAKSREILALSDENGLFSFVDVDGYMFIITAKSPGYLVDDHHLKLNYQYQSTIKCDQLSGKITPHVIRAWKLGNPSDNREIDLRDDTDVNADKFKADDKRESFGTIKLELEGAGEARRLLRNPILQVGVNDAWDLALSLVSGSPDVGEAPISGQDTRRPAKGVAVRVRARTGSVCQADSTFPFVTAGREFSRSIDLKWGNCFKKDQNLFFRVFYRNKEMGYASYITIWYRNTGDDRDHDCSLRFSAIGLGPVPQLGIVSVSGSENLEYFPDFIRTIDGQADATRKQRILRGYQERHLPEIRLKDPALAREIEERMRAEGKPVPP